MMKSNILRNLSWMTLQDVLLNVSGVLFFIVLARGIGESGLGLYSYLITITSLFAYILDFGLFTHYWRKWSESPHSFSSDLNDMYAAKILLSIIFTVMMLLYLFLFERTYHTLFFLTIVFFLLETFRLIPVYYLMSTNSFRSVCIANILDKLPAYILLISFFYKSLSIEVVLSLLIASKVTSFIYLTLTAPLFLPNKIKFSSRIYTLLKPSMVLFFVQLISVVFFKVDTVMLKLLQPLSEVGLYTAVYRILETTIILPNILLSAFFAPTMLVHQTRQDEAQKLIHTALKYIFFVSLLIATFIVLFSNEIMTILYTRQFLPATSSLKILGMCVIPLFVNVPLLLYALSKRYDIYLLWISSALLILNCILNMYLIPHYGAWGAACATLLSEIIHTICMVRLTKLSISTPSLLAMTVIFTSFFICLYFDWLSLPLKVVLSLFFCSYMAYKLDIVNIHEIRKLV